MGILEQQQVIDHVWKRDVDRRLDDHFERLEEHQERLAAGDLRMTEISGKLDANTLITTEALGVAQGVKADTGALVAAFRAWGGFTTVTKWAMAFVLGAAALIIAGGVIYWFLSTGTLPRKA